MPEKGGCGGHKLDQPGGIPAPWSNYAMCTNLDKDEGGAACGNNVIGIECNQNCVDCHDGAQVNTVNGPIKVDFLHSMRGPITCD